jgi:cell filamentation protein
MRTRYTAAGIESEFQPGSRGRVLRNLCGIKTVGAMEQAESEALERVQAWTLTRYGADHAFTADDISELHRAWLGDLYAWAGEYRNVNIAKQGFMFAAAERVPHLMFNFEKRHLRGHTPCAGMDHEKLIAALACTHAELVIIHPFRDGNGRCARLLAWLMALQAGLPPLDFSPMQGRGKKAYVSAIHAAYTENYAPMQAVFRRVIRQTFRAYESMPSR